MVKEERNVTSRLIAEILILIHQLQQTPLPSTATSASLDITNMYSNIPFTDTKEIIKETTTHNLIDPQMKYELINRYDIITRQNCFLNNKTNIENGGLAMGAPSSSINSVALVRERTIPTERPPPVGEVSANFCG
jgi:hypothetical protein